MNWFERIAVIGFVAALTWLLFKGLSPQDPRLNDRLTAINLYATSEDALHRDVLTARAGLLGHYDTLDLHLARMRDALTSIRSHEDAEGTRHLDALEKHLFRQTSLAESFRSTNAIVQNSLAYFSSFNGRASASVGQGRVRRNVDQLSSALLQLSLDSSPMAAAELDRSISALAQLCRSRQCGSDTEHLLAHARVLKDALPTVAFTVEKMLFLSSAHPVAAMRHHLLAEKQTGEVAAAHFRILLYLASLLLLALLVRWGLRVRMQSAALRRQVALEHAISTLSTRLLSAGQTDADIDLFANEGVKPVLRPLLQRSPNQREHSRPAGELLNPQTQGAESQRRNFVAQVVCRHDTSIRGKRR